MSKLTLKAGYIAISYEAKEGVSIRHFLNKLVLEQAIKRMEMLDDNKTSITLIKGLESQNSNKHIDVIHHPI